MNCRSDTVTLTINGVTFEVPPDLSANTSLNVYLREHAGQRDVKAMCHEGGCGVCIVSVRALHPVTGKPTHFAVNSCLVSVFSCHGWEITTVAGLGNKQIGYHPLQTTLAKFHGTQCGYCSPGMVMNMNSLLEDNESITMLEIENSFGGNICRCTGYRPIMDAFKTMASDRDPALCEKFQDIEDLTNVQICSKTGKSCSGVCGPQQLSSYFKVEVNGSTWYKVVSINNIIDILRMHQGFPYMLIAGNTGNGVYRVKKPAKIYIDVNGVAELRRRAVNSSILLGANVTLTETMKYLTEYSKMKEFRYVKEIVKHIDLIANVPVRNVGTIAGNLMLKHQNREFPSDVFLLLETAGARLTIMDISGGRTIVTPSGFLDIDMTNRIIVSVTLPAIDGNYSFKSYKIMIRAQNAHAFVNAGFYFKFCGSTGTVLSANIVYGGIEPSFIHATNTERSVVGMNLFDNCILRSTLNVLYSELNPDWILPDASPAYRKNLALALFYKFVLNSCPSKMLSSINVSGKEILHRGVSSGVQKYDTNRNLWPLQKPVQKVEGLAQCSGEAQYTGDIPAYPGELVGALVLARTAGSTISKIDPSKALAIPGVVAFFDASDIPGKNTMINLSVVLIEEYEELFCSEQVKYWGQPVGIIVAENQTLANTAAKEVHIEYSDIKPRLKINVREIIASGDEERIILKCSEEAKERGSNVVHVIRGAQDMGGQYHYMMETHTVLCVPIEDGLDVFPATQSTDIAQNSISEVLNMPECRINVNVRRLGGAYGMKITRSNFAILSSALAAHLLQRPVRMVMSLEDTMDVCGKRLGCYNDYTVEVDDMGKIQYLTNNFYEDHGCSVNESIIMISADAMGNCYDKQCWDLKGFAVLTDTPSNTWCRAPGTTEGIAMIENIMEHIAFVTGLDPLEVRLANMKSDDNLVLNIIDDFRKKTDYAKRKAQIDMFNENNRWRKRGIAILPMNYNLEYFGAFPCMVCIYHGDGTVVITHGGIECGQGINTKVAQVCAHILGISLEMVQVKPTSCLTSPNSFLTGAGVTSESCCYGVMEACKIILKRLEPLRAEYNNPEWTELIARAYERSIDLQATYFFNPRTMAVPYSIAGLTNCEVEIDILTGNVMILRVDLLEDTGESMSPEIDVGQVEGAFIMGLGYWLNEQIIHDNKSGELLTNRTWTYKPPGVKDIPIDFRVEFIRNADNPVGILRSKATGEPATCMSFVVICAIRHALQSARKQAINGQKPLEWFALGSPSTAEQIFLNSLNNYKQYTL